MKKPSRLYLTALTCASAASLLAQTAPPGTPEANGLTPKTGTFYVNTADTVSNDNTESIGVGIASNGNVIIGWEDDKSDTAPDINDFEAVWTLYNSSGSPLLPDTEMHSVALNASVTTKFFSYFRADNSPVPGITSWGAKIKADLFGDGIGMGATSYGLGDEVPEFAGIQADAGDSNADFPTVQLLTNDGLPAGIVSGLNDSEAQPAGSVRIADWDYLSNGNIVIAGESRQNDDLSTIYGGAAPGKHAMFRIVDSKNVEIKGTTLASEVAEPNEMWHGVGVTKNGFALRFPQGGLTTIRLFKNDGSPASTNIDLAALTGKPAAGGGGRGDSSGFHGNGNDAYIYASVGVDESGVKQPWITVLTTNGTVRFSRAVADDIALSNPGGADAAITTDGRVLAVFDDIPSNSAGGRVVMGRLFDKTGQPLGGTFLVSETELPEAVTADSQKPRVAWRGELAAVAWESQNNPDTINEVAARFFTTFKPGSIESAGLTRIVADTPVIVPEAAALGNWEPYASVVGASDFLIEANTFALGTTDMQRYVVMLQPVIGGKGKLVDAFYADNGTPFSGPINASRQNGNPGRVAGDKRPGAVNYMSGGETSVHLHPEFQSDNRWDLGFDRLSDGRYGTVQSFAIDLSSNSPSPLSKAVDSANGRLTSGAAPGNQITRFGGDIVALDNGNFVSVVEDRSNVLNPNGNAAAATIFAPNGSIVKDTFLVANGDLWANVAAFKGGFAVRVAGVIYFYDNSGVLKGQINQSTTGESYSTDRGDGTRIAGHINSPFVFLAGKVAGANLVKVSAFDSRDQSFVAKAIVSEPAFSGDFDRVALDVDALNRLTVSWVSQPAGYEKQQVAARVLAFDSGTKSFTPLTPSFLAFLNAAPTGNIHTFQMSVAMTTKQILIAAKGEINLENKPELGADSPTELNFYTVISHPDPQNDPTPAVNGGGQASLTITRNGANAVITWTADGYGLETATKIDGPWSAVATTGKTYSATATTGNSFFRLKK
ncbi:MAG: hypothetical protein JWM99_4431 [Verrucomicrobiales bacterium]|nr:hypothetical protein [Verrucomicrobiales bacterium]